MVDRLGPPDLATAHLLGGIATSCVIVLPQRAPNCSAFTFIAAVTLSSGVSEVTGTIACGSTG
jgi:hypothetical protein